LGLKREAGEIPARSRHCNWCSPTQGICHCLDESGREGWERTKARSQETCLWIDLLHFVLKVLV
jgi:hypothetical protein